MPEEARLASIDIRRRDPLLRTNEFRHSPAGQESFPAPGVPTKTWKLGSFGPQPGDERLSLPCRAETHTSHQIRPNTRAVNSLAAPSSCTTRLPPTDRLRLTLAPLDSRFPPPQLAVVSTAPLRKHRGRLRRDLNADHVPGFRDSENPACHPFWQSLRAGVCPQGPGTVWEAGSSGGHGTTLGT